MIGSSPPTSLSSGANANTARHRSPCTNTHPSDSTPTWLLTVPTSPIIPSLPVIAGFPLEARNDPKTTKSTPPMSMVRSEEHTSELQSRQYLVCRLLFEK